MWSFTIDCMNTTEWNFRALSLLKHYKESLFDFKTATNAVSFAYFAYNCIIEASGQVLKHESAAFLSDKIWLIILKTLYDTFWRILE